VNFRTILEGDSVYIYFKDALTENYVMTQLKCMGWMHMFCHRYQPKMAIKTSLKNVGDNMDGNIHVWNLHYMLFSG